LDKESPANLLIVGVSCAGKSTLARTLADRSGLGVVELDALAWDPGWQRAPTEVFRGRVEHAVTDDGWVAPGNYTAVRDILWTRADTIVWLDFSPRVLVPRILRRSWRRWRSGEVLWGGNKENFWDQLVPTDKSLVWFTLRSYRRRRREYEVAMADPQWAHLKWIRLNSPRALDQWLAALSADSPTVAATSP
jgi:adenylate kinase family enzyme